MARRDQHPSLDDPESESASVDPELDDFDQIDEGSGAFDRTSLVAKADPFDPSVDPKPAAARRSLGPTLLTFGAGVWAIAAALRCGTPEPGPSLSVPTDDDSRPSPDNPADPPPTREPDRRPTTDDPEPAADAIPADDDHAPDEPPGNAAPPPEPIPNNWIAAATPPKRVTYTIRRGGSIKNVANLFKIYHHEITALNPGVALEQELPPNSAVTVYRPDDNPPPSESIGFPSNGTLKGGVPMVEGPGRILKMIPWKSWGTVHTVSLIDQVLRKWAQRTPTPQPVLVGNMSARKGGRLEPHSTHQSGRDVDISYIQRLPKGEELNWRAMTAQNLDAAETWALLRLLHSTDQVEVIFIDTSIQKLLYDYAVEHGTVPKQDLARWLQYPRSGGSRALIQHVSGHVDHIHVRFRCQPHENRCKSKSH